MKKFGYFLVLVLVVAAAYIGYQSILPSSVTSPPDQVLSVFFLDVGQADAAVVQSGSSTLLIDAGSNSTAAELVKDLKNRGISKIDVLIGTHPHEDHIGGMDAIINQFDIGQIYLPPVAATTKTFEDVVQAIRNKGLTVTRPVPGNTFDLGSARCTILAPIGQNYEETNNFSIVIRISYGGTSFLFTGDAEAESEKEMLSKGFTLGSDVLKVGHHGSSTATSDNFLKAVSPRYAVISVGRDNEYGHPHPETLARLDAAGIKVYRTDLNGDIVFTSDGSNLTVKTEK